MWVILVWAFVSGCPWSGSVSVVQYSPAFNSCTASLLDLLEPSVVLLFAKSHEYVTRTSELSFTIIIEGYYNFLLETESAKRCERTS